MGAGGYPLQIQSSFWRLQLFENLSSLTEHVVSLNSAASRIQANAEQKQQDPAGPPLNFV